MEKKKIIQEIVTQQVNEHGEYLSESKTTTFSVEKEPDYVKLYIKDILRLTDIPKSGNAILFAVLRRMSYNSEIALFSPIKRGIASELGISEVTVEKAVELFTKKSILIRKERGLYIVNPFFFGKGKWEDIRKIRFEIVYSESGRMIMKTEIEEKDSVQAFQDEKLEVIDDKKHLEYLKKRSELIDDLEKVNGQMLENTKQFKKVA